MILTTEQAASKLGITNSRLCNLVKTNKIKATNKVDGKRVNYKFDSHVINEYLKENKMKTKRTYNRKETSNSGVGLFSSVKAILSP